MDEAFRSTPTIRRVRSIRALPSAIEKGGVRAAYAAVPQDPMQKALNAASEGVLAGEISITRLMSLSERTPIAELLRRAVLARGGDAALALAVSRRYALTETIFHDYTVTGVRLSGASTVSESTARTHQDITGSMARFSRRVIVVLAGPSTIYTDRADGRDVTLPDRAMSVHRFSQGDPEKNTVSFPLGADHRRPAFQSTRLTLIIDLELRTKK